MERNPTIERVNDFLPWVQERICGRGEVLRRMARLGHRLEAGEAAFEHIMRRGFSEEYGARHLLGVIRSRVEGAVAEALRAGRPAAGTLVERADGAGLEIAG